MPKKKKKAPRRGVNTTAKATQSTSNRSGRATSSNGPLKPNGRATSAKTTKVQAPKTKTQANNKATPNTNTQASNQSKASNNNSTTRKSNGSRGNSSVKESKRFQPHFRKAYNGKFTGHPQYVYGEDGRKFKIIGITKSDTTDGVKNEKLDRNPEPNNPNTAYIRTKTDKEEKGAFGIRLKDWSLAKTDKKKVRNIIDTHDKK